MCELKRTPLYRGLALPVPSDAGPPTIQRLVVKVPTTARRLFWAIGYEGAQPPPFTPALPGFPTWWALSVLYFRYNVSGMNGPAPTNALTAPLVTVDDASYIVNPRNGGERPDLRNIPGEGTEVPLVERQGQLDLVLVAPTPPPEVDASNLSLTYWWLTEHGAGPDGSC